MNRKEFLIKAGLVGVGLTLIPNISFAKESETNKKINLINDLKAYAGEHLELILKKDFFTKWSENEDPHYYLYVSEPDVVRSPKGIRDHIPFGIDKAAAEARQKEFVDAGKHTLLYSSEGAHDFRITNSLIGNSNEGLAILIFHEAAHQHFGKKAKMSIDLEQSSCEVMGGFGAKFFAERFNSVDLKKVKRLVKILERAYLVFNETASKISDNPEENERLYRKLEAKLFPSFRKSDPFIQQRFMHPVNNAYLLKNLHFSRHYDLVKSVAELDKFIGTFLYTMESLPKKEDKAIDQLHKKLTEKNLYK